jgi:diacylglycerol kinase (ATP)
MSEILGGVKAFEGARPDDGVLEIGVVTAKNPLQWTRTLGRVALGKTAKSPFIHTTRGKRFKIRFGRPFPYELDGGSRPSAKTLRIRVHPSSIFICVPAQPEISSGPVHQD